VLSYHNLEKNSVPLSSVFKKEDTYELCKLDEAGFTEQELKNNITLLMNAKKYLPNFDSVISQLRYFSRKKGNPQGWIIGALKGKIQDIKEKEKQNNTIEFSDYSDFIDENLKRVSSNFRVKN
jgi:hypothetical protein